RSMFNEALSLARQRGSKGGEISASYGIARLERKVGDLDGSLDYIKKATELIESTRDSMVDQQSRYGYFGRSQRIYEFFVDLLVERGDTEAAFLISERSRARALVEMIASSAKLSKNRVDSKLFEQEAELRQQANAAEQLRATAILQRRPKEVVDNAAAKLTGILRDLSAVQELIKRNSPEYSELIGSNMSDLATIQSELLNDRTQLLEFKLGDERSHLFVVSRTQIQVFRLPGRDVLNKAAIEFVQDISSRLTPIDRVNESTRRISDTLFADARKFVSGDRLLIVAEGSLNSVPFAALKLDDGEYLIDRSEIVMLPSAETLLSVRKYARNAAKPAKVLVIADPIYQSTDTRFALRAPGANKTENKFPMLGRLPATRREGRTVAALFGANSKVIMDLDASRGNLLGQELSEFAFIHVAAHGVLSDRRPELSGVVLSAFDKKGTPVDALLSLNDIYDLRLSAEMVVLSACESGLGRDVRGEGVIGMNRGFLFAGSRRVVSSLWKIDDVATGALMTELYGNMLGTSKMRPAAALRAAQLELKKQRRFGSPFYWAGLTLTGEWQ
ncbi:MAG: CHAT domain-containing protein, partial [Blastocatellia bacterium]|nr:CHAT domain-containing protein [Blastocatellia bacterium]